MAQFAGGGQELPLAKSWNQFLQDNPRLARKGVPGSNPSILRRTSCWNASVWDPYTETMNAVFSVSRVLVDVTMIPEQERRGFGMQVVLPEWMKQQMKLSRDCC